jgi:hypothetical protein
MGVKLRGSTARLVMMRYHSMINPFSSGEVPQARRRCPARRVQGRNDHRRPPPGDCGAAATADAGPARRDNNNQRATVPLLGVRDRTDPDARMSEALRC